MLESLDGDLEDIVFEIISDADQRQAVCLHSVAKGQSFDFDEGPLARQSLRNLIEVGLPLRHLQCSRRTHGVLAVEAINHVPRQHSLTQIKKFDGALVDGNNCFIERIIPA